MIVVVASSADTYARGIVAHWDSGCAALLTAEDLCSAGWSVSVPRSGGGIAVIGGHIVRSAQIKGILTLRPYIFPAELRNVHPDDRAYVAAELNAFLTKWLMAQSCPVLNPPSVSCLSGPGWRAPQWIHAAARLGIPVRKQDAPVRNNSFVRDDQPAIEVVSVGERCFGSDDPQLQSWSLQLARTSGAGLLSTRFSVANGNLLSADPSPRLTDPSVLAAVWEYLGGQA